MRIKTLLLGIGGALLLNGCLTPPAPFTAGFVEGNWFMLSQPYVYRVGGSPARLTIPEGFVFDYASVPTPLHGIYAQQGRYSRAALVHDYLYATGVCTREQADNLFAIAMRESGVPRVDREAIYGAVRVGGAAAWDANAADRRARRPRIIPRSHRHLVNGTWPDARAALIQASLVDPTPAISAALCAKGNTTIVPTP